MSTSSIPRAVFTIDSRSGPNTMLPNPERRTTSGEHEFRSSRGITPVEALDEPDSNSLASFHSSHEHLALRKLAQSDDVASPSAFYVMGSSSRPSSQPSSRPSSTGSKILGFKSATNRNDNHSDVVVDVDMLSQSLNHVGSDLDTLL